VGREKSRRRVQLKNLKKTKKNKRKVHGAKEKERNTKVQEKKPINQNLTRKKGSSVGW